MIAAAGRPPRSGRQFDVVPVAVAFSLALHLGILAGLLWWQRQEAPPEPPEQGVELVWDQPAEAALPSETAGDTARPEAPPSVPPPPPPQAQAGPEQQDVPPPPGPPPPSAQVLPPPPAPAPAPPPPPQPLPMPDLPPVAQGILPPPPPLTEPPPPVRETPVARVPDPPEARPDPPRPEPARPQRQAAPRTPPRPAPPSQAPATQAPAAQAPSTQTPPAPPPGGALAFGATAPPSADPGASNPAPAYPAISRLRGEEGVVGMIVTVGPDGRAQAAQLVRSSGHQALDDAARRAVLGWRFRPALRNGEPVSGQVATNIRFTLQ